MADSKEVRTGFHRYADVSTNRHLGRQLASREDIEFTYTFENFFHPFVGELIQQLNTKSLDGMLDPNYHQSLTTDFFDNFYTKLTNDVVKIESFPKDIDFRDGGPYANYNWELFFHIPLTIAVHLSKNQRFAEAQRWFHYIFDPTSTDTKVPTPQRFWKFLAFRQSNNIMQIDELLRILSDNKPSDTKLIESIRSSINTSNSKPFQPHAVARSRPIAYQYSVVMKYLDNLIAWGDSLFRQDTIESINEATQIYVLAANLLGTRPQKIPSPGNPKPQTFAQLKARGLDATGNTFVELEGKLSLNLGLPQNKATDPTAATPLFGIGRTLYFCIPKNEKMLGYWDTVGDRLFKIRHYMNIEGIVRQLALFDPPIDPGMLVKAAAAGLDIGSIVNGLNQPVSPVRAILFIQKALELCGEVRSLGGALLSAIEKGEGEHLALLRQSHEIKIQQMQQDVRFLQWKQAQEATTSLLTSRATALERLHYYQRLLGLPADPNAPDTVGIDRRTLTEENFDEIYTTLVNQYDKSLPLQSYSKLKLAGTSSPANQSGSSGSGNLNLNINENSELNELLPSAKRNQALAFTARQIAPAFALLPDFPINVHFWGIGGTIIFGGSALTKNIQTGADVLDLMASRDNHDANSASKTSSYERRADDWMLQHNMAAHELMQIGRQMLTSLIAEQVAKHEYENTQEIIKNSQEVDRFLHEKFTNEELYSWMQGEISRLYYEYYRFAFDTARKAEQTMKRELMRPEVDTTTYIKFNYWDAGRKGLLSGEALYLDLKRMEMAYHENNKREYELTKHVSLLQMSPLALLQLRTTGNCTVSLPEEIFDMDGPGHYFRRIKTVAVSIPCVTGPYTSINCTLTLLKSSIRTKPLLGDGYPRSDSEDDRFNDSFGSLQTIVTSTGQNDSGLFETNLRDERYLPFEGAGVISEWKLSLPANPSKGEPCQFDYNTISDAILHVRYTAREAGELMKGGAIANLTDRIKDAKIPGLVRLFSIRHEFPTEWAKFQSAKIEGEAPAELTLPLRPEHYPFWGQGNLTIKRADLFIKTKETIKVNYKTDEIAEVLLVKDASLGNLWAGKLPKLEGSSATDRSLNLTSTPKDKLRSIEDMWVAITWGKND